MTLGVEARRRRELQNRLRLVTRALWDWVEYDRIYPHVLSGEDVPAALRKRMTRTRKVLATLPPPGRPARADDRTRLTVTLSPVVGRRLRSYANGAELTPAAVVAQMLELWVGLWGDPEDARDG